MISLSINIALMGFLLVESVLSSLRRHWPQAPADATLFYTLYLYIEGFSNFHMGYAAAMAWVLLAIIAVLTALAFLTSRYWVYNPDA